MRPRKRLVGGISSVGTEICETAIIFFAYFDNGVPKFMAEDERPVGERRSDNAVLFEVSHVDSRRKLAQIFSRELSA